MQPSGRSTERPTREPDVGLTHVALPVTNAAASVEFYRRYANLSVVHERSEAGKRVVWLSDLLRKFVIVFLETEKVDGRLEGFAHLGVACKSREEVDRLCAMARSEGRSTRGPADWGDPVGYWAFIRDPDGHNLELSYGQEVGFAIDDAQPRG
jgi:catechol 2,3-dioxygenase-like lactoylglutathione lyase family enzyme